MQMQPAAAQASGWQRISDVLFQRAAQGIRSGNEQSEPENRTVSQMAGDYHMSGVRVEYVHGILTRIR